VTVINFLSPGADALVPCPKCEEDTNPKCDLCNGLGEMGAHQAGCYIEQRIKQMENGNGNLN